MILSDFKANFNWEEIFSPLVLDFTGNFSIYFRAASSDRILHFYNYRSRAISVQCVYKTNFTEKNLYTYSKDMGDSAHLKDMSWC